MCNFYHILLSLRLFRIFTEWMWTNGVSPQCLPCPQGRHLKMRKITSKRSWPVPWMAVVYFHRSMRPWSSVLWPSFTGWATMEASSVCKAQTTFKVWRRWIRWRTLKYVHFPVCFSSFFLWSFLRGDFTCFFNSHQLSSILNMWLLLRFSLSRHFLFYELQ